MDVVISFRLLRNYEKKKKKRKEIRMKWILINGIWHPRPSTSLPVTVVQMFE